MSTSKTTKTAKSPTTPTTPTPLKTSMSDDLDGEDEDDDVELAESPTPIHKDGKAGKEKNGPKGRAVPISVARDMDEGNVIAKRTRGDASSVSVP